MDNVKISIVKESKNDIDPSYSIVITGDGTVKYNGIKNVRKIGVHCIRISEKDIEEIVDRLNMIYFFSLRDNYISNNGSSIGEQTTVLSAQVIDKVKQIEFTSNSKVPHSLNVLVNQILEITKTDKMVNSNLNV